jgi:hypothetical protein
MTEDEFVALPPLDVDTFIAGLDGPNHSPESRLHWIGLFYRDMIRAALANAGEPLDAAWSAVTAAMPEGWELLVGQEGDGWWATATEPRDPVTHAYRILSTTSNRRPTDPTPAGALRHLAVMLAEAER